MQLGQLQKVEADLIKLGYQLVAVSPDTPAKLAASVKKNGLNYLLLSDSDMAAAKAFGIAYKVNDGMMEKLKSYKIDIEAASGRDHHLLPVPSVFVSVGGVIQFQYVNPNYAVRLDADVLLLAAEKALGGKGK